MRKSAVVAFVAALTAAPALAADKGGAPAIIPDLTPSSVSTSCYVQGFGSGSVIASNPDASVLPASLSAQNWGVGVGVGCDVKMERFIVGALARVEIPVDTSGSLIELDKSWMAALRVGYMLNGGLMAYGLAGYESSDFSLANVDLRRDGLVVGGGLEIGLSKHLSLTTEYTYTGLGSSAALGVPVDTDAHKVRVGIQWRFNSLTD